MQGPIRVMLFDLMALRAAVKLHDAYSKHNFLYGVATLVLLVFVLSLFYLYARLFMSQSEHVNLILQH